MKKKIYSILFIICNGLIFTCNASYASTTEHFQAKVLGKELYGGISSQNGIFNVGSSLAGYIVFAAWMISAIVLVIKGIKFITSSPEGKADVKKELIPWFVGLVILTSANIVFAFIKGFSENYINML